jgi:tetratricopeptide (TPR) repeat protein
MIINYIKVLIITISLFYPNLLYSKTTNFGDFNSKSVSSYFSALISYNNQKNINALNFFNKSKSLIGIHEPYLKNYIYSLVLNKKILKAIKEIKNNVKKKDSDFFESYLLLILESYINKNYKNADKYLDNLASLQKNSTIEVVIYDALNNFSYLFKEKKIKLNQNNYGNLSLINRTLQNCYLGKNETDDYFLNIINNDETDYSRYIYFYASYLIENKKFEEAKKIIKQIDYLNSSLLTSQAKKWIEEKKFEKFNEIFSCKNEIDILGEFFFLISTIYSSQSDYEKSNFFLNISNYLNPKFKFNHSLQVENYFQIENYKQSKKSLLHLNNDELIYYWYGVKKKAMIILKESNDLDSFNFINSKFQKINEPSTKILFDMANISKNFKKYELAIEYYNQVLKEEKFNPTTYADILYRRGSCYERLGNFEDSDKDLLESLKVNPNDAYVLNYLAYSWLERDHKIDISIQMLEKAYEIKKNDPFILDSIGWAYYLIKDINKAEKFLNRAIQLMPEDPIVNDHYGDILWKMNRKLQAKYYWKNTLKFKDTKSEMKKDLRNKILNGLSEL